MNSFTWRFSKNFLGFFFCNVEDGSVYLSVFHIFTPAALTISGHNFKIAVAKDAVCFRLAQTGYKHKVKSFSTDAACSSHYLVESI